MVFPREEHTTYLSTTKSSALNTYIQVALYGPKRLFMNMRVYIDIYACSNNKRRAHEFEGEREGTYGSTWRDEREGRCVVTYNLCVCLCMYVCRYICICVYACMCMNERRA